MNLLERLNNKNLGLLLIRLALGLVFVAHGWQKLQGLGQVTGFFGSLGLPTTLAYAVALIEFVGGLLILAGWGVRIAAGLIALVMIGAIYFVKFKSGFIGGYELEFTLLLTALALVASGGGKYSLLGRRAQATNSSQNQM